MVLGQLDIHMQKNTNLDTDHISFTKISSQWIINLIGKYKSIKLLEDIIGENLDDFGYGDTFLDTTSKTP